MIKVNCTILDLETDREFHHWQLCLQEYDLEMTVSPSKGACGAKVHREGFITKSCSSVEEGASGSYSCMELLDIAATNA